MSIRSVCHMSPHFWLEINCHDLNHCPKHAGDRETWMGTKVSHNPIAETTYE